MEEFELEGVWWLPETPGGRVSGKLEFSPGSGASLDLLDSLYDPGDHLATLQRELAQPGVILGLTSKGKPVTL